jgi:DNA-directed RNA polymerase specialized sigma24 family protein
MTDSARDKPKKPQSVSPEALAQFLELLSPDEDEACRLYMRLQEKLVGFFNLKGVLDPHTAADETIDRAMLKISAGAPVPDVGKYCMGIARNLCLERFRSSQREGKALQAFVEDIQNTSDEQVERIYQILKPCFDRLGDDDRQLLFDYCRVMRGRARSEHRRRLAETMTTTVLALRMRITRLRSGLADCVRLYAEVG